MGENSAIAWTDHTFNPWRGCRKITSGCANCYMFTRQSRYGRDPSTVKRTKTWGSPLKWQKEAVRTGVRKRIFTCSWSDWFISDADQWRDEAWDLIRECDMLDFQILTKRPERIRESLPQDWPLPNVWLGVSVENRRQGLPRIDLLRRIPASIRFLSIEPLLEDLGVVDLTGIDWVIVGGESGPGYRPMDHAWALSLLDQCQAKGVAFFFKQSAAPRTEMGVELGGRIVREYPTPRTGEALHEQQAIEVAR